MIGGSSLSGPTQLSILPGQVHEQGGNLGLSRGGTPGPYYSGTLVTVVTAILKTVSLSGGHTVAMELPTSMGIKQGSSLRLAMYVSMYDPYDHGQTMGSI